MVRLFNWVKKEFLHVFPAFLFFFISFNVINMIEALFLRSKGIPPFSFYMIFLAAAVIAKILVVIDHLPFINVFPKKPLIYNVLWKVCIYEISAFIVRILMRLVPLIISTKSFTLGYEHFKASLDRTQFLSIQILYLVLFFTFVTAQDFIVAIGPRKVRKMFFGK